VSVNYDTAWLESYWQTGEVGDVFRKNVAQALKTSEPGFSFNFWDKESETLRNACCEVTSSDPHDVCNLASVNFSRIADIEELKDVVHLTTKFLLCGTMRADLPYFEVYKTREKNRRLGLGIMGLHEWLIARGYQYEVTPELHKWLSVWRGESDKTATSFADFLGVNRPAGVRAIAPTGTIGILAGTSTGIEPIFATAYKRRYLVGGTEWRYQYVVDSAAEQLVEMYGLEDPDSVESAMDLAAQPARRVAFQADVQDYVDQAISSTINLPAWGTDLNNEDCVDDYAKLFADYAHRLRGITVYADGSRGGQPLTPVPYSEAKAHEGETFIEAHDVCDITGGGSCGI
jgi:ribonucleoside-diphosphate reductase alpha chain